MFSTAYQLFKRVSCCGSRPHRQTDDSDTRNTRPQRTPKKSRCCNGIPIKTIVGVFILGLSNFIASKYDPSPGIQSYKPLPVLDEPARDALRQINGKTALNVVPHVPGSLVQALTQDTTKDFYDDVLTHHIGDQPLPKNQLVHFFEVERLPRSIAVLNIFQKLIERSSFQPDGHSVRGFNVACQFDWDRNQINITLLDPVFPKQHTKDNLFAQGEEVNDALRAVIEEQLRQGNATGMIPQKSGKCTVSINVLPWNAKSSDMHGQLRRLHSDPMLGHTRNQQPVACIQSITYLDSPRTELDVSGRTYPLQGPPTSTVVMDQKSHRLIRVRHYSKYRQPSPAPATILVVQILQDDSELSTRLVPRTNEKSYT